mmetsp:Transcript_18337/g.28164  ORF Transcript_18337/g.28164 Transcript_18337/m.28164 type:complete len:94 (-) Transcript_18337:1716-1997(-)
MARLRTFGTTVESTCSFDLDALIDENQIPKQANLFYDMFLVDYDGSLVDVPVKVNNAKTYDGQEVNSESAMDQWILTRRFFMFDTLSGVQNGQ